jgi:hypothetical protein
MGWVGTHLEHFKKFCSCTLWRHSERYPRESGDRILEYFLDTAGLRLIRLAKLDSPLTELTFGKSTPRPPGQWCSHF